MEANTQFGIRLFSNFNGKDIILDQRSGIFSAGRAMKAKKIWFFIINVIFFRCVYIITVIIFTIIA